MSDVRFVDVDRATVDRLLHTLLELRADISDEMADPSAARADRARAATMLELQLEAPSMPRDEARAVHSQRSTVTD